MPPISLLVFVVGAGALGSEIAAVRLLAPYFGASEVVWANTIGVVLVALSIGYWYGGKLGDRRPRLPDLCVAVSVAAALTAALPFVARPLLNTGVDALDSVSAGAFVGSLIATLLLLAIPVFVMGTVAPWALRLGIERVDKLAAGALAGRLYAISTAGSLVGTLACSLLLIPAIGTRRTFLAFALLMALVGMLGVDRRWRPAAAALSAAIVILMLIPLGGIKGKSASGEVIHERETHLQYVRVIEKRNGTRHLELNEGQARHSVYRPGGVLIDDYWDALLVLPLATTGAPPSRMAILGNAAGTTARAYERFFPQTKIDGVEIDGELTEIGQEYFDLNNPNLTAHTADARPFLRTTDERYDAIALDAYRQPYIPFYLTTREFFALAETKLTPDGVITVNVGHPKGSRQLERVLAGTMGSVFENVWRDPTRETNTMLVASNAPLDPEKLIAGAKGVPELQPTAVRESQRLVPADTSGDIYTDDHAPVEWLIDRSIVEYAAGGGK